MMRIMIVTALLGSLAIGGCQQKPDETVAASNTQTAAVTPPLTSAPAEAPPAAPAGPALGQANDAKGEIRMDVTEAVRAGGVLTIKTRFALVAGKPGMRSLPGSATSDVYLTAGDKKYLVLEDDRDKALMSSNSYPTFGQVGAGQTWWGKFPAPTPDVKAINFYFTDFAPVENIAITDR